ncbi:MAG: hypothetical protein QM597_06740 [Aeromicrobium sp.]|uniref:hypothetical protein n=1 Tax=Aeromicrobium sp. TaxID=1871063 RepID=UPI0039E7200B
MADNRAPTRVRLTPTWLTPARRAWLYDIAAAVCALLAVYGVVTHDEAVAALGVLAALLRVARENVPPR